MTCGDVQSKNFSPEFIGPGSERFIKASYCAFEGDSGSGVYFGSKALGIHSGGGPGGCSDPGDFSYFGHIEYAQNALNVNVVKAP